MSFKTQETMSKETCNNLAHGKTNMKLAKMQLKTLAFNADVIKLTVDCATI